MGVMIFLMSQGTGWRVHPQDHASLPTSDNYGGLASSGAPGKAGEKFFFFFFLCGHSANVQRQTAGWPNHDVFFFEGSRAKVRDEKVKTPRTRFQSSKDSVTHADWPRAGVLGRRLTRYSAAQLPEPRGPQPWMGPTRGQLAMSQKIRDRGACQAKHSSEQ